MRNLKNFAEIKRRGSSHYPFLRHHQFIFPFTYGGGSVTDVHHVPSAAGFVGGPFNNNVYEFHQPFAASNLWRRFTLVPMTQNQFNQALHKKLSSIQITDFISFNFENYWNKVTIINLDPFLFISLCSLAL
ncbi:hypothetical protein AQUCO_03000041v1 [Aquilegia coerulea]|uniref:Uncharacterized protein n=1 Tax=Aquilegia coerulea TaxID=218851 RepID=A0A2G5D0Y8_AQUCA|nr:hypothetical protein AQUCO_03000041v1 [Aquilegia coerulea]